MPINGPSPIFARHANDQTNSVVKRADGPGFPASSDAWIFDLDNTLYPADSDLFVQIDARMTAFVQDLLDLDFDAARKLQKAYYRDHGTTLNGLMRVNGIDPEDFLASVHDIDLSVLRPDPSLASGAGASARAGDSSSPMAAAIMPSACWRGSTLESLFDEIWDIRTIELSPEARCASPIAPCWPHAGIAGSRQSAMFEDVARNLVPAHVLGWTTVWLRNGSAWSKQGPQHPIAEPDTYPPHDRRPSAISSFDQDLT